MNVKTVVAAAIALLSMPALAGCDWMQKKDPPGQKTEAELKAEQTARIRRACASQGTYDRLKELAFDEAARIRGGDARALDAIAQNAVVRMEEPVAKSRDEDLNVTVCTGRFILELPPGAENAFDGQRRLTAEIEYAAQAAADGSGLVFQMSGAEPIIYRLATVGGMPNPRLAQNQPVPLPTPQPAPDVAIAEPQAPPPVAPRASPAPPQRAEPAPRRTAASPSFNCANGRSRSERMICGSGSLAALDRQMSSRFYSALANGNADSRRALRRSRDRFLAYRERCPNEACIAQAYRDRMDEIRDIDAAH